MKKNLSGIAVFLLLVFVLGGCNPPKFGAQQERAKEVVLQQSLWVIRRAIDYYAKDKGKFPKSLEDLVTDGYLREIPADPFTGSNKTWVIQKQSITTEQNSEPGITDIQSGAPGADRSGKPYRQY